MKKLIPFLLFAFFIIAEDEKNVDADPFEDINRVTFEFNESLDRNFLKPVAQTYSKAPKPIKKGITNFFNNLEEVETTVNQVLQGKPKLALNDLTRFVINSTIGLGGFIDVATKIGLTRHEEDFDQTLDSPHLHIILLPNTICLYLHQYYCSR